MPSEVFLGCMTNRCAQFGIGHAFDVCVEYGRKRNGRRRCTNVVFPRLAALGYFHATDTKSKRFNGYATRAKLRDDRFTKQRQLLRPRRARHAHMQHTAVELRGHRTRRVARAYSRFPITSRHGSSRIGRAAWRQHLVCPTKHCAKLLDPPQLFSLLHCRRFTVETVDDVAGVWGDERRRRPEAPMFNLGTEGGSRTHKPVRTEDFESSAFAIPPLRLNSRARED